MEIPFLLLEAVDLLQGNIDRATGIIKTKTYKVVISKVFFGRKNGREDAQIWAMPSKVLSANSQP